MNNFVIFTDSTADLSLDLYQQLDLKVVPLSFIIDGHEYLEDPFNLEISAHDFYDLLRTGQMVKTSQIPPKRFLNAFEPYLKKGQDILMISFSSALSGSYNSLLVAKEILAEQYPNRKIVAFDSKCASMGEGLLIYYACLMKQKGASIEEIHSWLQENYLNLCHWFTVEDLDFLRRGGRLSGIVTFFGKLLKIKPVLHVDDEGRLVPVKKAVGRKASLDDLFNKMVETIKEPNNQVAFISHGDSLEDATYLKNRILNETEVTEVIINNVGAVIGSHSGPGTIALFFLGEKR